MNKPIIHTSAISGAVSAAIEYDEALMQLAVLGGDIDKLASLITDYAREQPGFGAHLGVAHKLKEAAMAGVDLAEIRTKEDVEKAIFRREILIAARSTEKIKRSMLASKPLKYIYLFVEWLERKLERWCERWRGN